MPFDVGTYWFPRDIYELTLDSRPASPGTIDPSRNRSPPIELCCLRRAGDPAETAEIDRNRTQSLHGSNAAAAQLIPVRKHENSAGSSRIRRCASCYFSESTSSLITLLIGFRQSSP